MANLTPVEQDDSDAIVRLEVSDPVLGYDPGNPGAGTGKANEQGQATANTLLYLKRRTGLQGTWDMTGSSGDATPDGAYTLEATAVEVSAAQYTMTPANGSSLIKLIGSDTIVKEAASRSARLRAPTAGGNLAVSGIIIANSDATPAHVAASLFGGPTGTCTHVAGALFDHAGIIGAGANKIIIRTEDPINGMTMETIAGAGAFSNLDQLYVDFDGTTGLFAVAVAAGAPTSGTNPFDVSGTANLRVYALLYFTANPPNLLDTTADFDLSDNTGGRTGFQAVVDPTPPTGAADGKKYLVTVAGSYAGRSAEIDDIVEFHSSLSTIQVYTADPARVADVAAVAADVVTAQADATQALADAAAAQADATTALANAATAQADATTALANAATAQADATQALADAAAAQADATEALDLLAPAPTFVSALSDFPAPSGGVITLPDGSAWCVTGYVALTGVRIVFGGKVWLTGVGASISQLIKTDADADVITPLDDYVISDLTIGLGSGRIGLAVAKAASPTGAAVRSLSRCVFWSDLGVTIDPTTKLVYEDNTHLNYGGTLPAGPLALNGTYGTANILRNNLVATGSYDAVTATNVQITNHLLMDGNVVDNSTGGAALALVTPVSTPAESIMLTSNTLLGAGSVTGFAVTDNSVISRGNHGIPDSIAVGHLHMDNNATATTISIAGTYYKAEGTTSGAVTDRFTHSNNRLTYTGTRTEKFEVNAAASFVSGSNNQRIGMMIAKNGTVVAGSKMRGKLLASGDPTALFVTDVIELATNDYIEAWVTNETGANSITAEELQMTIGGTR